MNRTARDVALSIQAGESESPTHLEALAAAYLTETAATAHLRRERDDLRQLLDIKPDRQETIEYINECDRLRAERDEARTEVERLRCALEDIANATFGRWSNDRARVALGMPIVDWED